MSKTATKKKKNSVTPLMKQYNGIKSKYPDALLLFRVGDFYETFGSDAVKASRILGIVLTKRHNGSADEVELAGFPHHSLDTYLPKLVRAGERVAICDQLEEPSQTKKIVRRGVTELVTPGVAYNDEVLNHKSNNFLAALNYEKEFCGVSFLDVSTGEFLLAEGSLDYIDKLIQSFKPSEIIYSRKVKREVEGFLGNNFYSYPLDEWVFTEDYSLETLLGHYKTKSLKGFGVEELKSGIVAAGAALHYMKETQHDKVSHINSLSRLEKHNHVWLDKFTIRNLELFDAPHKDAVTLLEVLDHTISPMGARMLRRWMALPLKDVGHINERLNTVDFFINQDDLKQETGNEIRKIGDLERLISKVAVRRVHPRELVQLKRALEAIPIIKKLLITASSKDVKSMADRLNECEEVLLKLTNEIVPEPAANVTKGRIIAEGVSDKLDELYELKENGKFLLKEMQEREINNTGIPSLKIAYNNVFGYYIEVRNSHKDKVPTDWIRKQTLVNAERYITQELKEYESKILGAEDQIIQLEQELLDNLISEVAKYVEPIQINASIIARLDCLLCFSELALRNNYTKPEVNDSFIIDIKSGRHPVIEHHLPTGEEYISNDVYLDNESQQIMMITGPNMSGKSALLRQTALITLMAQLGSYVPATHASLGIVDKIFTRVGASDNISSGESTFMVEMNETASILNNLSDRSLILLDEIGRGTSTYDGISIAWAIAEYLHQQSSKPKTLFATHYHELNDMSKSFERIKNYNVSVKETDKDVIFLRKLKKGGSEHSFGIHVAKMAGMPVKMLQRSEEILKNLEMNRGGQQEQGSNITLGDSEMQLSFFQLDDPVLEQIREELIKIEINSLTPVEALMKLNEIKKMVGGK